ncbi:four-carbon acid sugar kinase family protein, partial [Ramlibacter alkalitolerans]
APRPEAAALPPAGGLRAIVSGSCSQATQAQVADFIAAGGAARAIDPLQLADDREGVVREALDWAAGELGHGAVLVYSTDRPESVRAVQERLGVQQAGALVEDALASIAKGLVQRGVRQLVVAGGETSGAVVQALGVAQMRIGRQIDPGVPWCHAAAPACDAQLHLALKSGNFGSADFFRKAFALLA